MKIFYELWFFCLIFSSDLIGDQLGITFCLQPRGTHFQGENQVGDESFIFGLVIASFEFKLQFLFDWNFAWSFLYYHPLLPLTFEAPSIDRVHYEGASSSINELNFAKICAIVWDLMLLLRTYWMLYSKSSTAQDTILPTMSGFLRTCQKRQLVFKSIL